MRTRVMGLMAALVLALVGTVLLVGFVRGAEERALDGVEVVDVVVVDRPIAAGSPANALADRVRIDQVPSDVRAVGHVQNLDDVVDLDQRIVSVDLVPGEQLVLSRLVLAGDFEAGSTSNAGSVLVPLDQVEVTLALSPTRTLGGEITPGSLAGAIASFAPFDLDGLPGTVVELDGLQVNADGQLPNTSHFIGHQLLVTNIQLEEVPRVIPADAEPAAPAETDETGETGETGEAGEIAAARATPSPELAPTGNLLVTLAMPAETAEQVVFAAEFGTIWLVSERPEIDTTRTEARTRTNIYEAAELSQ